MLRNMSCFLGGWLGSEAGECPCGPMDMLGAQCSSHGSLMALSWLLKPGSRVEEINDAYKDILEEMGWQAATEYEMDEVMPSCCVLMFIDYVLVNISSYLCGNRNKVDDKNEKAKKVLRH